MVTPGFLAFHPDPKKPDQALPENACDSHCHVFGPGAVFAYAESSTYVPVDAPKETLFQRHRHLGISRAVVVQASCHGTDNAAMLDALRAAGNTYRGIAVVADDIDENELTAMHAGGVRGVRFNFVKRLGGGKPLAVYRAILAKIKPLGWHIVVYFDAEDLEELAPFLREIEVPVVVDHMGRVPVEQGTDSKPYALLQRLLNDDDRFWVKISCPERLSRTGPPYADVDPVARGLLESVPERVLWGTDWPHPNMKSHMPDDGALVDRIMTICDTETLRRQVLVDNPTRLYWAD
jgi:2-pyrone-4,6-dicarboxylate lactonase